MAEERSVTSSEQKENTKFYLRRAGRIGGLQREHSDEVSERFRDRQRAPAQSGTTVNYFLADHLGSTNGLTDSTGALASQTAYDSFGNQTGNLATRYGFTGRERDDFTGLMYCRARFYDPAKRFWITNIFSGLVFPRFTRRKDVTAFSSYPYRLNDPLTKYFFRVFPCLIPYGKGLFLYGKRLKTYGRRPIPSGKRLKTDGKRSFPSGKRPKTDRKRPFPYGKALKTHGKEPEIYRKRMGLDKGRTVFGFIHRISTRRSGKLVIPVLPFRRRTMGGGETGTHGSKRKRRTHLIALACN